MIELSRYLPEVLQQIIDPVIHSNSYFASPEHILQSMLTDDRKYIRKLGLRRIQKARNNKHSDSNDPEKVRKFVIRSINFQAKDYIDMIL